MAIAHVVGLDVSVHHALVVQVAQPASNLRQGLQKHQFRQWPHGVHHRHQ